MMNYPDKRKLFTISEVTRACGVSRATLIRIEESGFMKPFRIDPDSGYRYYDTQNIAAIGQYQRLQAIGLSRAEIADLYHGRTDSRDFIRSQREKLGRLQQFLDEYEVSHDHEKDFSVNYVTLPEITCCCLRLEPKTIGDISTQAFLKHEKCISEGYQLLGSEPLSVLYADRESIFNPLSPKSNLTMCVPVIPRRGPDPNVQVLPATEALSVTGFGGYDAIIRLWEHTFAELETRKLEPSGPYRLISLVAYYTSEQISETDICSRCIVPIKRKEE